jgi:hypothetical protein
MKALNLEGCTCVCRRVLRYLPDLIVKQDEEICFVKEYFSTAQLKDARNC